MIQYKKQVLKMDAFLRYKKTLYMAATVAGYIIGGAALGVTNTHTAYAANLTKPESSSQNGSTAEYDAEYDIAMASIANVSLTNPSERLITNIGDQAISFLSDPAMNQDAREEAFRDLLINNFDMKTIGRFVLGRYWRTATGVQKQEYLSLFEKMVVKTYSKRFSKYSGENLVVIGSRDEGGRDRIVSSVIKSSTGSSGDISVDWRVRTQKDGTYKVVDVIVEGISMSVTQRSDFSSVIQRGGGNIEALLTQMRDS